MNNKTLLALGLSFACYGSAALAVGEPSDVVTIDFDGTDGGVGDLEVGALDWAPGSSLSDGASTAALNCAPDSTGSCTGDASFQIYTHAKLLGYIDADGNAQAIPGNTFDYEWTFIFGATEEFATQGAITTDINEGSDGLGGGNDVYTFSQAVTFTGDTQTNADGFFFNLYYDTNVNSDALTGQGYDDGVNILSATTLDYISGAFASDVFSFTDLNNNGVYDVGEENNYALLDGAGTDNWSDANNEYLSVIGTGATSIEAGTITQNFDFIKDALATILADQILNTSNNLNFLQTQPSMCFNSDGTTALDTAATQLCLAENDIIFSDASALFGPGALLNGADLAALGFNGGVFTGEDVMFQTDLNHSMRIAPAKVPEPGIMALLGMGLGLMGLNSAKRRRRTIKG